MKQKYTTKYTKRKGFSLLELLVVVAILAIIGGAVITAYDGLVSQSQKATATNTIGSLTNSIRQFKVVEGNYPNNWESLMAATPTIQAVYDENTGDSTITVGSVYGVKDVPQVDSITGDPITVNGVQVVEDEIITDTNDPRYGDSDFLIVSGDNDAEENLSGPVKAGLIAKKLADKFVFGTLTAAQANSLVEAGITKLRYTHTAGIEGGELTNIFTADEEPEPTVGPISEISIPQHAFEAPREDKAGTKTRNRGRGFVVQFGEDSTNVPAAIWDKGTTGGYNNIKVGANPNAVLVGLGIGNANTLVDPTGNSGDQSAAVGSIRLATAPYYGDVAKNSYQHYIALFDVSQTPAVFVAVVDSRGDFLDEEFAESTGQKK